MTTPKPLHDIRRIKSHQHQAITIKRIDGSSSVVMVPNGAVTTLQALLKGAKGNRLVCTTAIDLSYHADIPSRTVATSLQFLEKYDFVQKLYQGAVRRVRLATDLASPKAAELSSTLRETLATVQKLGAGAKEFTLYVQDYIIAMQQATPSAIEARHRLNALVAAGAIVDVVATTHKVSLYRIDVQRTDAETLTFQQLAQDAGADRLHPKLLLAPTKLRAVAGKSAGEEA